MLAIGIAKTDHQIIFVPQYTINQSPAFVCCAQQQGWNYFRHTFCFIYMPWLRTRFGVLVYLCWLQLAARSTRIAAYSNQEGISLLLTGVFIHISLWFAASLYGVWMQAFAASWGSWSFWKKRRFKRSPINIHSFYRDHNQKERIAYAYSPERCKFSQGIKYLCKFFTSGTRIKQHRCFGRIHLLFRGMSGSC